MSSLSDMQREICVRFGTSYLSLTTSSKIGIGKTFDPKQFPLNGLRHPPEGDTTGWYIWSGEKWSSDSNFFQALHVFHLDDRCPEVMKYLGLGPGWRFLIAPGYEDVWFDPNLLRI